MACPLSAHLACRLLDYLKIKYEWPHLPPPASLLIALMISSTDVMNGRVVLHAFTRDYEYKAFLSAVYPTPFTQPIVFNMFQQGWGRLNLRYVMEGKLGFLDRQFISAYSQPQVFTFQAKGDNLNTILTIAWLDPPATVDNDFALVNDLNLRAVLYKFGKVVAVLHGNMQSVPDSLNTREKIVLDMRDGDIVRVVISTKGPIVTPNFKDSFDYHRQMYSFVHSSSLVRVQTVEECTLWDPEYECIVGEQEGVHACVKSHYDRSECLVPSGGQCNAGEVYSQLNQTCHCVAHMPCLVNLTSNSSMSSHLHISHFVECNPETYRLDNTCANSLVTVFSDIRNRTKEVLRSLYHHNSAAGVLSLNENREPFDITVWVAVFLGAWILGIVLFFISSRLVTVPV